MPLHDFHCPSCGSTTEVLIKSGETPKTILCPACDDGVAKKVEYSSGAFSLQGPGWFVDGYVKPT